MKIGILGGTFNPVHLGHTEMARFCLQDCSLDKIMFLPLGDAPHKTNVTPASVRLEMLEAALSGAPDFFISRLEIDRRGKTYTYDTVKYLTESTKDDYTYIIGGDTVNVLDTWRRAEEVFKMIDFIVINRENEDISEAAERLGAMGARLNITTHTGLDISSTAVREYIALKKDVSGMVDKNVLEIIRKYKLYENRAV